MSGRDILPALFLLLCLMVDSSHEKRTHAEKSPAPPWGNRNARSKTQRAEVFSEREMTQLSSCADCDSKMRRRRLPTSIADKINILSTDDASPTDRRSRLPRPNAIVPKESERVLFSRKYSPQVGGSDSFVPVPGPFGMKTSYAREKTPFDDDYPTVPRSGQRTNAVSKRHRAKSHAPRHTTTISIGIHPQTVQRRAQYRSPKVLQDELAVKESVANENILGNGNFEIIRGGMFSDQERNEILGSRRSSRGFGNYAGSPTFRQNENRLNSVQFPPLYQGHAQNPVHPIFFPRAPY